MGRTHAAINDRLSGFLLSQPVFFVASAPLSGKGLVNCSPKSNDGELAVIDLRRIAYLDRTGSGVETIAHLRENGRIVLMFCAFQGPPRIVRIHGHGSVVGRDDEGFEELAGRSPRTGSKAPDRSSWSPLSVSPTPAATGCLSWTSGRTGRSWRNGPAVRATPRSGSTGSPPTP